jgi:phosphate transport system permease protein
MISSLRNISFRWHADRQLGSLLMLAAGLVASLLILVLLFLMRESWPVLRDIGATRFWSDDGWHPSEQGYGLTPMLSGTLLTTLGALALAAPLGIASALFCRFYAPPAVARAYHRIAGLLAGIPSVVYGFWGLTTLVPLIARWEPPGASLLAGILILALMVLPTIALTSEAALAAVPETYLHGAAALGLSRRGSLLGVVLPAARAGIVAGVLLAMARALGETMAVLMVGGNVVQVPSSLFDPVRTLTANIALEMAYAQGDHRAALFVSGLLLSVLVLGLALAASHFASRRTGG